MSSTSHHVSTSLFFVLNLSTLVHSWRWPSASQTAQSFSDLLRIKDRTPQTIKGSQQQQNGATMQHIWSSLGANQGSGNHIMRSRGLDVSSPYSSYGLIHKVLWDSGRRGKSVQHLPWGLKHREVWLSEGSLLVLRGGKFEQRG